MDEHLAAQARTALRTATEGIQPSAELDARVASIVGGSGQGGRPRWLVPALAAAMAIVVAAGAVVAVVRRDGRTSRVVAAGPKPAEAGRWVESPPSPLSPRSEASVVWTGREAIVWGGTPEPAHSGADHLVAADGAAFDPGTGRWRRLAPAPLSGRYQHVAVWTGKEMIVWGGVGRPGNDGAAYDPTSDTWRRIASAPLPPPSPTSGSSGQQAVWTGSEMLVWGRVGDAGYDRNGAAYNPSTDSWRALPPLPGVNPTPYLAWTGDVVLAFPRSTLVPKDHTAAEPPEAEPLKATPPGAPPMRELPPGMVLTLEADAFDPKADSWHPLPASQIGRGLNLPTATWADRELLVVSPPWPVVFGLRATARYRPSEGAWQPMTAAPFPPTAVTLLQEWTGMELVVVINDRGPGGDQNVPLAAAYSPDTDQWRAIPVPDLPTEGVVSNRVRAAQGNGEVLVWNGERVLRFRS